MVAWQAECRYGHRWKQGQPEGITITELLEAPRVYEGCDGGTYLVEVLE